jgi:hypothetical protein
MSKAAPPFTKPIGCHRAPRVFTTGSPTTKERVALLSLRLPND